MKRLAPRPRAFSLHTSNFKPQRSVSPTCGHSSFSLLCGPCGAFFCPAHELVDPILKKQRVEVEFFTGQCHALSGKPGLEFTLVLGKLFDKPLYVDAFELVQSLFSDLFALPGGPEELPYPVDLEVLALLEKGDQAVGDPIRQDKFVANGWRLDFTGLIMEKGIVEVDRRMVVHAMVRDKGDKHAQRFVSPKQAHRSVSDEDGVTGFVEILSIIPDNFVERRVELWQGHSPHVEDQ